MKFSLKKIIAGAGAAVVMTMALPPAPASAISPISCATSGAVRVTYGSGGQAGFHTCFGGRAGPAVGVSISDVKRSTPAGTG